MRTIFITFPDINGPQSWWTEYAWAEVPLPSVYGSWKMTDRVTTDAIVQDAGIASIDCMAIGLRGVHDGGFATAEFKTSLQHHQGTICPWIDTGALGWNNEPDLGPFDFANPTHLERVWTGFLKRYFAWFPETDSIRWERTKNARPLVAWWGINGTINPHMCQRLLDHVDMRMHEIGLNDADHLVDQSWVQLAPSVQVFAVHDWFDAATTSWTVRTHNGITTGVVVPGFHDPPPPPGRVLDRRNGQTLRDGLAAIRVANADYVLLEGHTDVSESAGFYRSNKWSPPSLYLDIVREHVQITNPVPVTGGSVAYARLSANNKYIGVEPKFPDVVYANRDAGGAWEELVITKHDPYSDILAKDANVQIGVDQASGKMVTRKAGDISGWGGQWAVSPDGKTATCAGWTLNLEGYVVAVPIHLEQRGYDFVDASGKRIVYPGIDGFDDVYFAVQGRSAELDALMTESVQVDVKVRRIWCMGDAGQNQVFSLYPQNVPNYLDVVRQLVGYQNSFGIIPLFNAFVDAQVVMPNQGQRQTFWRDLNAALVGSGSYLMSGGNQYPKNGFDPWADLSDPGHGVIWSRGSSTDDLQTIPKGAPASELHATRVSFDRALMDSTASPPEMRKPANGSGMVWMTEGNPFGDSNGYNKQQAWQLGRGYSILWALAVHHNRQSQRGQLMTAECAETCAAWVQGMTL